MAQWFCIAPKLVRFIKAIFQSANELSMKKTCGFKKDRSVVHLHLSEKKKEIYKMGWFRF